MKDRIIYNNLHVQNKGVVTYANHFRVVCRCVNLALKKYLLTFEILFSRKQMKLKKMNKYTANIG